MEKIDRRDLLFSNQALVRLILPLVVEQLLSITVGLADTIMIAAVGESAVSGVSLVDSIFILLINIFAALATGGAVVCGQFLGRKQNTRACFTADQLLLFTTVSSIVVMALLYVCKEFILSVVFGSITPEVRGHAETYLLIVSASIPFIALYNCGAALFRTMGNSKISMLTSLLMNVINITGNAILIYGFQLGVAGAAIPTLVSRIVAAVVIYLLVRKQSLPIHVSRRVVLRPQFRLIKKILYIGVPSGLENSMFQLGKILVLSLVATFGTASITANAVSNTVATFQTLPGMAAGLALITVVSRCVGAGDYAQARYYTRKIFVVIYIGMVIVGVAFFLAIPGILHIYNLSAETFAYAEQILYYHGSMAMVIWPFSFALTNTLRAANDVKFTMVVSICSMWIFRIGFSYLLGAYFEMGVFGVWVAMTIDWVVRAIFFVTRYLGHRWERHTI